MRYMSGGECWPFHENSPLHPLPSNDMPYGAGQAQRLHHHEPTEKTIMVTISEV